jgi:hypothetical protein
MVNRIEPPHRNDKDGNKQSGQKADEQPDLVAEIVDEQNDKQADSPSDVQAAKTVDKPEEIAGQPTDGAEDQDLPGITKTPEAPAIVDIVVDEKDPAVIIQSGRQHRFRHWLGHHKKVIIPIILFVLILGVLAGVSTTRYMIAGLVLKQQFSVAVVDSQTGRPVSSATITMKGQTARTDNQGKATLKVPVGKTTLELEKKYYKAVNQEVLVPIKKPEPLAVKFEATGRQVPVSVVNKISGKPLANVTLSAESTQVITDKNGEATIVLPAGKSEIKGTLAAKSYNNMSITVKVIGSKDAANTFQATPVGKLYFLSNAEGTVDVVKTDLDGQNRQIVAKGTGKEEPSNTVLLASQSWKYLALRSKRDGGTSAKMFLIDTSNDAMTTMDEGDAEFNPIGWTGTTFVYTVNRHNKQTWTPKANAIKSYEAGAKKLATLDETNASGNNYSDYFNESYSDIQLLNNEVVFGKTVSAASLSFLGSHQASITSIRPDGSNKKVIKSWAPPSGSSYVSVAVRPYLPNEVYVANTSSDTEPLYEYEDGQLKTVDGKKSSDIWNLQYFTYLFSPSNDKTFWSEPRDGKFTLFIGDDEANSKKQVATLTEYQTFGWYTDDYALVSKSGSELYIAPAATWGDVKPLKITDYYKPNFSAPGYGKGYGGY